MHACSILVTRGDTPVFLLAAGGGGVCEWMDGWMETGDRDCGWVPTLPALPAALYMIRIRASNPNERDDE